MMLKAFLLLCVVLLAAFASASQPIAVDVHRDSVFSATTHTIKLAKGDDSSIVAAVGSDLSIKSIRATCDGLFVLFNTVDSLESTLIARVTDGEVKPVLTTASGLLSAPTSFVVDPMADQIFFTAESAAYGGLGIFSVPYADSDANVATEMLVPRHARASTIDNLELFEGVLYYRLESVRGDSSVLSLDLMTGETAVVGGAASELIRAFRIDEDGDLWAMADDGSFLRCTLADGCSDVSLLSVGGSVRNVADFAVVSDDQLVVASREGALVVDTKLSMQLPAARRSPSVSKSVAVPVVNASASVSVSRSVNVTETPSVSSSAIGVLRNGTASAAASEAFNATRSVSASSSPSTSSVRTSVFASKSVTATPSVTRSVTASLPALPSANATSSISRTSEASASMSNDPSVSSSASETTSQSLSISTSMSKSMFNGTRSVSISQSASQSVSVSQSVSSTMSRSEGSSFSPTPSLSLSNSASRSFNASYSPTPTLYSASFTPIISESNSAFLKVNGTTEEPVGPSISTVGWELLGMAGAIGLCLLCIVLLCCWKTSVANEMAMSLRLPDSPDDFL